MPSNYISRRLIEIRDDNNRSTDERPKSGTLYELISKGSKRLALLGDAGTGKSTELENCFAVFCNDRNDDQVPILIPLNTYTGDDFRRYAEMKIGLESATRLLEYNKERLIFFLDEFDQVIDKELAARQIINFMGLYHESAFIVSCRSNFYTNQFPAFVAFILEPLDEQDIEKFAIAELPATYQQFIDQIRSANLMDIATIPFFLIHLIDLFKIDQKLPNSQAAILEMVIDNAIHSDMNRLTRFDLYNRYPADVIKEDLSKISMIMEVLQKNYLRVSELNQILGDSYKSEVIRNLNLLKKSTIDDTEVFQFEHNNFNEYLAARKLSKEKYKNIIDFLSVKAPRVSVKYTKGLIRVLKYIKLECYGLKISDILVDWLLGKKNLGINPSWVNTLGFLCQIRTDLDILKYLIKYHPEIALLMELARLSDQEIYDLFKVIFDGYIEKKIIIRNKRESIRLKEIISLRDGNKDKIYKYLMDCLTAGAHFSHRYNALNLLCYIGGKYNREIIETYIARIIDPTEDASIKHICLISLVELKATDASVIDQIMPISDTEDDYILSGLYVLLSESKYVENYVNILMAGIPKSKNKHDSDEIRLGDERFFLFKCLESIKSPSALKTLIDLLVKQADIFHEYEIKKLIPKLVNNLINAYSKDKYMYEYAKELLMSAQRGYSDELTEIGNFFLSTNTTSRIVTELLEQGINKHYEALAGIVNEEVLTLIVDEYNKRKLSEDNVHIYIRMISLKNHDMYQKALDLINSKTGNKFAPEPPVDYKALDLERLNRQIEIIFNKDEFINELNLLFKMSGKDKLTYKDTGELEHENYRSSRGKYNSFIIDEVQKILIQDDMGKEWSLDMLIETINKYDYDLYTVDHIYTLLNEGVEVALTEPQIEFIKQFCIENLNKVDFKTALSVKRRDENGNLTHSANRLAVYIWGFKRRLHFGLPNPIMLDMLSFDWFENLQFCGIDYLLKELDHEQVVERIIDNLRNGIPIGFVLLTHIEYCIKNNITGVLDDIYKCMNGEYIDNADKVKIMGLLMNFEGGKEYVRKFLRSSDMKLYDKAAELLLDDVEATNIIIERMNDSNQDIAIASARRLIPAQNVNAIEMYVSHIVNTGNFKEDMNSPIGSIETIKALDHLTRLLLFFFEHQKEMEGRHNFLLTNIIQAFKNIARKDNKALENVLHLLDKFVKNNEKRWEAVVLLNYYRDEITNDFYSNYKEVSSLSEAIDKVSPLFN